MPAPLLTIASVGLPILQQLGQSRDVRRYKQQLEQQQKTANLVNALSKGRIQYQPTAEYKPSTFTRVAGAANTGLGAYQAFKGLQNQQAATDRAAQLDELRLLEAQRTGATQEGLADYYSRDRPKIDEWTPQPREQYGQPPQAAPKIGEFTPPPRTAAAPPPTGGQVGGGLGVGQAPPSGGPQLRGGLDVGALPQFEAPGLVSSLANLDKYRAMGAEQGRIAESKRLADLQGAEFDRQTKRIAADAQAAKAAAAQTAAAAREPIKATDRTYWNDFSRNVGNLSPQVLSFEDFKNHPALANVPDDGMLKSMYTTYKLGARERATQIGKLGNERIEEMTKAIKAEAVVRERSDIRRSITEIVDGIVIGGGFGDVGVLKALAKLQDPGSVVRQEEFTTLKEGLALFDRAGIKLEGYFTGTQLNARGRKQVLELAYASYNRRMGDIDNIVDAFVTDYSGRPGVPQQLTKQDFVGASLPFRLPDPAEMITPKRKQQLEARVGGQFRTDLDMESWMLGSAVPDPDIEVKAKVYQNLFNTQPQPSIGIE